MVAGKLVGGMYVHKYLPRNIQVKIAELVALIDDALEPYFGGR